MIFAVTRDLLWLLVGRIATAAITLIALRYATAFLVPAQYGELALLTAVQSFCGLFLINPVGQHINRHTHRWWDDGTLLPRLASYQFYVLVTGVLGATITLGLSRNAAGFSAVAMLVMITSSTWNMTLVPMLNMLGQRPAAVGLGIFTAAVSLVSSIFLVRTYPSAGAWFAGQTLGMLSGALWAWVILKQRIGLPRYGLRSLPIVDRSTIRRYCMPLAIATGFMWLQLNGYRFLVEHLWGLAALGFIAVGLSLAGQLWSLVETLAQQLLLPLFYRRVTTGETSGDHEKSRQALSDLLNIIGPTYIVLAGATILGAGALVSLLMDQKYTGASFFLMIGASTECCRALAAAFSNAAQVTKRTGSLFVPYAMGALITLPGIGVVGHFGVDLSWIGVPFIMGAFVMLLTMAHKMRREVHFHLDAARWSVSFAFTIGAVILATRLSLNDTNLWTASIAIFLIGVAALFTLIMLLRGSGAIKRLLAVPLHNGTNE